MSEARRDRSLKGHQTANTRMVVTQASGFDGTVYISHTEKGFTYRILVVRNDGTKCEFVASEWDLRAARKALDLMANEEDWDSE